MFILVSLFISITGYLYLCNIGPLSNRNYYYFYIKDVEKIDRDAGVYLNGMNVGHVCNIQFFDETLLSKVTICLRSKLKLNENSEIVVTGVDLLYKRLNLNLNNGDIIKNNSEIKVVDKSLKADNVLSKLDNVLNNLSSISNSLSNTTRIINNNLQKIEDTNTVDTVIETINKCADLVSKVKVPWFFRK